MKIKEFYERFFTLRKCAGCGEILSYEQRENAFCDTCRFLWDGAKTESCPDCFRSSVECTCQPKELASLGVLCLRKLIFYQRGLKGGKYYRAIYYLKRRKNKRIEAFFAKELSRLVFEELSALGVDEPSKEAVITYVPRGIKARRAYGFDHAERIARSLGEQTGIPCVSCVKRVRIIKEQKKLTRRQRFQNAEGSFCAEVCDVNGKAVFLFDDIVTTGASMYAAAKIVKKGGARCVIGLCVAQD